MAEAQYAARLTMCKCGHKAIEHYDSWRACLEDDCDCGEFEQRGPEIWVNVGAVREGDTDG